MWERRKRGTKAFVSLSGLFEVLPHWPPQYDSTIKPTLNTSDKRGDFENEPGLDNNEGIIICLWTGMKFYVGAGRRWVWRVREFNKKRFHFSQHVGVDSTAAHFHSPHPFPCSHHILLQRLLLLHIHARCAAWDSGCGFGWSSTADLNARLGWQCKAEVFETTETMFECMYVCVSYMLVERLGLFSVSTLCEYNPTAKQGHFWTCGWTGPAEQPWVG